MGRQKRDALNNLLVKKDKIISKELLKKYLKFQSLSDIQKELCRTKSKDTNKITVSLIENG